MKLRFFLITLCIAMIFSKEKVDNKLVEFLEHCKKYNKTYSTPEEFEKRFQVFKENKRQILKQTLMMGAEFKNSDLVFEPNYFADLTQEEFKERYLTFQPDDFANLRKITAEELGLNKIKSEDLPENFDWRDRGIESPVKKQGRCGGCWSFTTCAVLEAQYQIETEKQGQKKEIVFSEQQLIDCDVKNDACGGGNMKKAFIYLSTHSLMEAKDYQYEEKVRDTCDEDPSKGRVKVSEWAFAPKDEEEMKKLLYTYGPLGGAINSMGIAFYSKGIYEPRFEWLCPGTINHAVTIYGYGTEKDSSGNKKDYWIVKNSWGPDWGEKGYFRILRGKKICGINQYTLYAKIQILNN